MPGLERETEVLEGSKRNSSQTNCTVDSGVPLTIASNVDCVQNLDVGVINSSTSVVTTQENNKSNVNI